MTRRQRLDRETALTVRGWNGWTDVEDMTKIYDLPNDWRRVITEILDKPVQEPNYYKFRPGMVSGEIDTDKRQRQGHDNMTGWNQQPAQGAYDDVMNAINGAKEAQSRDPFFPAGTHQCIVVSIEPYNDSKWGPTVRMTAEIETSTNTQCGKNFAFAKLWNLKKPSKFPTQETDADNFVDFVCKVQNVKLGEHGQLCHALLKSQREGGQLETQPARGMRFICNAREAGKANEKGQRYVACSWAVVPQDMAAITAARRDLDVRRPFYANGSQAVGAVQPQGGYAQPAPQMQPQGGYAQPAPPAPQMQPQGGYAQPAPQMQPQGGYAQPAPQMQPQGGYAQPAPTGGGFGQFVGGQPPR